MNPHEAHCRQLLANGASAWASDDLAKAKIQQEKIFHWLDAHDYLPTPDAPVLELGCGNDVMVTQYLAERGHAVPGVDVSGTTIRWAEGRFRQADLDAIFFVDNAHHLSQCEDTQFTLIIDDSCLHYLLEDECRRFFAGARKLLKPAGRLMISSMYGFPRYVEDLTAYNPVKHHLLKEGQP